MEDLRAQKKEALQALTEYSPKLIRAMKLVVEELKGNRQPDTDEYLRSIVNGMNWEIEIFNLTRDYINESVVRLDKDDFNRIILQFNDAYTGKDDLKMAALLEGEVLEVFEKLEEAARELSV
ncbi:MAG: molecular chaperone [Roseburia sp.]